MQTSVFILPRGIELGGVTVWSIKMTRHLIDGGYPANLLRHQEGTPDVDDSLVAQLPTLRCPGKPAWSVTVNDLKAYLPTYQRALPATLIPNWTFGTYAACASLSCTQADTMRVIGLAHSDEDVFYAWLEYYEPIIHTYVAVSEEIATNLKVLLPHRSEDIVVRSCPVDVPSKFSRGSHRRQGPIRLMYAGRVQNQQKRVYDLLVLVKRLNQKNIDFELTIVGDGMEKQWLQDQFVRLLGADAIHRVVFTGKINPEQMPSYWQSADVSLLVSEFEGTSISMLESMAQGCVPVVTAVSGTKAVIQDGNNGFTVPVGDMGAMADTIQRLDEDRQLLQQIGQRAYHTVLKNYAFADYISWFVNLTEQTWKKPPRKWPSDRLLLPDPLPTQLQLTRYERAVNKLKRHIWNVKLMMKLYGIKAIPSLLRL